MQLVEGDVSVYPAYPLIPSIAWTSQCPVYPVVVPWREVNHKGKGQILDIALLHDEHMLRSALQSRKWQLIGMS